MSTRVIDCEATSNKIRHIMEEKNINPKDVQEALHFDCVQTIYKWISPKHKTIPSLDSLVQLAGFLDCEIGDLIVVKNVDDDKKNLTDS